MKSNLKISDSNKKNINKIAIIILALLIYKILGSSTRCIFKNQIGIPCPACGMTRAFENLINGNIKEAFYYHPLFIVVILVAIMILFRKNKTINRIYKSKKTYIFLIVIIIGLYIIRMILFFPDIKPMDYYEDNMLNNIIELIKKTLN